MRKKYTAKYKAEAVLEVLQEAKSLNEIAGSREVHPNMLGRWKNEAKRKLHTLFEDRKGDEKRKYEEQIQELYVQIGELSNQLRWLKKNLVSTYSRNERIRMVDKNDPEYSVKEQCELLELNRTSLYYKPVPANEIKLKILKRIDELYTMNPSFGGATMGTVLRREGLLYSGPLVKTQNQIFLMGLMSVPFTYYTSVINA